MRQRLASCLQLQLHDEPCAYWSSALLPAVDAIAQALYPCTNTPSHLLVSNRNWSKFTFWSYFLWQNLCFIRPVYMYMFVWKCSIVTERASSLTSAGSWPLHGESELLQLLMRHAQYERLQEWAQLTHGWCEWHASTTKFMLAFSHLNTMYVPPPPLAHAAPPHTRR